MGARKLRHLAIIDRAQRRRTHGRGRDAPPIHTKREPLRLSLSGGEWGSNPRLSEAVIRFRNLLTFSRLTNQFSIIWGLFWDNFGTLFQPKIAPFFPRLSNCISGSYNALVVTSFRTFFPLEVPSALGTIYLFL